MASTYTPIATTTLGSSQATVTFSSIPSTYTDLVLVINAIQSAGAVVNLQVNSDTGSNYSYTALYGTGSAAGSGRGSALSSGVIGYIGTAATPYPMILNFMNYANTTTYKTVVSRSSSSTDNVYSLVNLWRSTSAINSITAFINSGPNFSIGSTFTLYGIKAA